MPLSKARNRERMRIARLHIKAREALVQPKLAMRMPSSLEFFYKQPKPVRTEVDADGNLIYEE